jgi:hypothetical protein
MYQRPHSFGGFPPPASRSAERQIGPAPPPLFCNGRSYVISHPFPRAEPLSKAPQSFVASIAAQYGRRLHRFLSARLRNSAEVPDLAQKVFLRLLRVADHEGIRSPEAYLFTVASHVIHQHSLRKSAEPVSVDIADVFPELQALSADDPDAQADQTERIAQFDDSESGIDPVRRPTTSDRCRDREPRTRCRCLGSRMIRALNTVRAGIHRIASRVHRIEPATASAVPGRNCRGACVARQDRNLQALSNTKMGRKPYRTLKATSSNRGCA